MKNSAINQAISLRNSPEELAQLHNSESPLPNGITELLTLCTSEKQIQELADTHKINPKLLLNSLLNFIELVMLNNKNSNKKTLGLDQNSPTELLESHYQLLMNIYDKNDKTSSTYYSKSVTEAYDKLKNTVDTISFSDNRHLINGFSKKKNPSSDISNTKTLLAITLSATIFALVGFTGKSYSPAQVKSFNTQDIQIIDTPKNLIKVSSVSLNNQLSTTTGNKITDTELQNLLTQLENAYEEGDVDAIKPILANSPEIKSQSGQQINDKLETLFEITTERKMVLFDFKWTNNNTIQKGSGRFLSRYKLVGEEKWLTREGIATVSAKNPQKELEITQLILENTEID